MLAGGDLEYESIIDVEDEEDDETETRPKKKHKDVFVHIINLQNELREKIYPDQTGKFPVYSSQGNQYR